MRRILVGIILLFFTPLLLQAQCDQTSSGDDTWTNTFSVPTNGDVLCIAAGETVDITGVVIDYSTILNLTIIVDGTLLINSTGCGLFTCANDAELLLGAGCVLEIGDLGTIESTTGSFFAGPGTDANIIIDGTVAWDPYPIDPINDPNPATGPAIIDEGGFMPVELLYLEANINQDLVEIDWATSFEENFSHFEIEHSTDKKFFEVIGAVDGVGESIDIVEYSYDHLQPMIGTNYYRLNAIDLDGSQEYFGPLEVEYIGDPELLVYPNPVANFQFNADLNFQPARSLRMTLMDHSGKTILDIPTENARNRVELPPNTASGLYLLTISDGARRMTQRFIVE